MGWSARSEAGVTGLRWEPLVAPVHRHNRPAGARNASPNRHAPARLASSQAANGAGLNNRGRPSSSTARLPLRQPKGPRGHRSSGPDVSRPARAPGELSTAPLWACLSMEDANSVSTSHSPSSVSMSARCNGTACRAISLLTAPDDAGQLAALHC